jgi:hypothetical protein
MKRILVIAGLLTAALTVWGQTVGVDSYVGDMQETMVNRWTNVPLGMLHTGTLNGILEADLDLTKFNALGVTNPTHLDLPQVEFESRVGATSRYRRSRGLSRAQTTRHTRKHSRRHYRRLR